MARQHLPAQHSWWKLALTGLLRFAFGVAAISLPAGIMFRWILDVIFGDAKPLSGSMTSLAALLAVVALIAIDGLLNLFGTGVIGKRITRLRGMVGIAVVIVTIFWPGMTIFVAVEMIGLWAVLIGILELSFARESGTDEKDRSVLRIARVATIEIGVAMMRWVFWGAVLVGAVVGAEAAVCGVRLIESSIYERAGLAVSETARPAA
jgi:uncharacterized membrane protein HdeD (DUF308 family)